MGYNTLHQDIQLNTRILNLGIGYFTVVRNTY